MGCSGCAQKRKRFKEMVAKKSVEKPKGERQKRMDARAARIKARNEKA